MKNVDRQLTDYYNIKAKLGSGTYGQVWLASRKYTNQQLSVKQSKIKDSDRCITPSIFRELVFLSEMSYPHIIHFSCKDVFLDLTESVLSFAYEHGAVDVRKVIHYYANKNKSGVKTLLAKSILFQLLLALDYLHKRSIAHCDITPPNLLLMSPDLDENPGILKLIDFGLSRVIETTTTLRNFGVVTIWYRAPELLLGNTLYDQKIDIWAAGCIFAELLTGKVLFALKTKTQEKDPTDFNPAQVAKIVEVLGPMHESDFDKGYKYFANIQTRMMGNKQPTINNFVPEGSQEFDLISKMLKYNPKERISASEALRHPYFNMKPICALNISAQIPSNEWQEIIQNNNKSENVT